MSNYNLPDELAKKILDKMAEDAIEEFESSVCEPFKLLKENSMSYQSNALVIFSGGQDSTAALLWAKANFQKVFAVTFDYGQTHAIEIQAAVKVGSIVGVSRHQIIRVPEILYSTSPLTSEKELEEYKDFDSMVQKVGNEIEDTFIPMRNAFFAVVGANRAIALGCKDMVMGVCAEDTANYPDCRASFIYSMERTINDALGFDEDSDDIRFKIHTPVLNMPKSTAIKWGKKEFPKWEEAMAHTHTSYDGKYPPTGMNHANILRAKGFEEAGIPDPLVVRAWQEKLMQLPETNNYNTLRTI